MDITTMKNGKRMCQDASTERDVYMKPAVTKKQTTAAEIEAWFIAQISERSGIDAEDIDIHEPFEGNQPLSFAQQRLYILDQIEGRSTSYSEFRALSINGQIHLAALEQSMTEIINRHEVLRTIFPTFQGRAVQVIVPTLSISIPVVNLQHLSEAEQSAEVRRLAIAQVQRPFDLANGPLLCVALFQLAQASHVLMFSVHRIVADKWSVDLLFRELAVLYKFFSTGTSAPASLPELPIQYSDFASWQRQRLAGEVLETQLKYWKQKLAGAPALLQLPTDRVRPAVQTFRGGTEHFEINSNLTRDLKALSERSGATLFMTLLAAFVTLLSRYSNQEDVVVGSPIANRNYREIKSLIGPFANTLALRADLSGNPTCLELLNHVRQVVLEAYAYQDLPFEKLVNELQPEQSLSYTPLFQTTFVLQNRPTQNLKLPGLAITSLEMEELTAKFDLTLSITDTESGLLGCLAYKTDLFDAATISRMAGHFQTLLKGIVANPDQRVRKLPLLTVAERHQLIVEWNDTKVDYPTNKCIWQLFEAQVEQNPEALAVVFEDEQLSYRELNVRANQLAHHLQTLGVGPEALVGICVERSLEMVVGLLGILKSGGTYMPLDPAYPMERLAFMLEDSQAQVLLTQKKLVAGLPEYKARILCLDTDWPAISQEGEDGPVSSATIKNLAYVIYTSGSTGKPKGVAVSHKSLLNLIFWHQCAFKVTSLDRATQLAGTAFDASVWELWPYLTIGASLYLVEPEVVNSPVALWDWLALKEITISFLPTPLAEELLALEPPENLTLRILLTGGDKLHHYPSASVPFKVVNNYGPTENTVVATSGPVVSNGQDSIPPHIGHAIANVQTYILDQYLQPVPIGVPGELHIGGDSLARGYLNRPDLTEEKFIPNPFSDEAGARLYKTGDIVRYLPDGNIKFYGRIDHQVKIRGFRIELAEIEAVLVRHPALREVVVIAREYQPGNKQLVAYLVLDQDQSLTTTELRGFLNEKLPYYMIPSAFVMLEALPLTPNDKVDRNALPAPKRSDLTEDEDYVGPRTPTEEIVASIWVEILDVEKVGIHDNFFELGGHSLSATQVIPRLHKFFPVELSLIRLFEFPTVAILSGYIDDSQQEKQAKKFEDPLPVIVPAPEKRYQPFPLTDVQQAYWLGRGNAFELGNVATHVYFEIATHGLDLKQLNLAWQKVIARHDMLRAIVLPEGEQQILEKVVPYQILVQDLCGQNEKAINIHIEAIRGEMSHQVLPTDKWPLFDIRATRLDKKRLRLHLSFDALILDASGMSNILNEWSQFYRNLDLAPVLPEISFRDYVLTEKTLQNTELYQRSQDYWFSRLDTLPPAPELPLAQNPGSVLQPRFKRRISHLDQKSWEKLQRRATQASLTPSGLLLAVYAEVIAVWSKSARFTINLTLFNRLPLHSKVDDIIGDFTSLTLLEVDSSPSETFITRALRLQRQLWQDLDYRYFSGVKVLRELTRRQGSAQKSLMPVVFTSGLGIGSFGQETATAKFNQFGEVIYGITQTPQVWLDHQVAEQAGGLVFNWDSVEELFPEGLLDDMFEAYCYFLKRLANEEKAWHETMRQLIPAAQLKQRVAVNTTVAPISSEMLHTLFAAQLPRRSKEPAVISSNRTLSYEELSNRSNQVARLLREKGTQPNTLVAVVMEKDWEQVVAVLGILQSGGAYLPIDPTVPKERLWHLLDDGKVSLVLTQSWLKEKLEWPEDIQRVSVDTMDVTDKSFDPLDPVQRPEDLAYVIYTSGSTGLPKGVMIDHRGAVNTILDVNQRFDVGTEDRALALANLNFDLSVYDIFGSLATGGTIVLPDADKTKDPAHWLEMIARNHVTVWNSVPALMQMLVEYASSRTEGMPQSLRLVLLSGDWIPLDLPDQIKALMNDVRVIGLGGATEASIWSNLYPIEEVSPDWKSIPYGCPMVNQRFYVLNEFMEDCPDWVPGQLYIGGIGLAHGYWRDEEKAKGSFIIHSRTGERLYRTGDLGRYLPDGNIEFLGREDFQVKISGYRIELGEIEAALKQHPGVRDAVVTAVGDTRGDKRLVGYVVMGGEDESSTVELQNFLKEKLPGYMVPSAFVVLDAFTLTPNGKVDRKALPEPSKLPLDVEVVYVAPQTEVEQTITTILQEVLGIENLGIHNNFFDLGGNSLHLVRIQNRLEKTFKRDVSIVDLFQHPTINILARHLTHDERENSFIQQADKRVENRMAARKRRERAKAITQKISEQ